MELTEIIKSKLSIEEVVSDYVSLKKAGRNYKGLCPFHQEKTPSFIVSPDKGLAYCFGCQKGGDVFQFVQEVEGIDFVDSLKILSKKAGVDMPSNYTGLTQEQKTKKSKLFELNEKASQKYIDELRDPKNKQIVDYLTDRGLNKKTIETFSIGYAPEGYEYLSKDFKSEYEISLLEECGLFKLNDKGELYDKFRGRIMFPIKNQQGLIVGFTGRVLNNQEPKYLNTPETSIFHKGNVLYGLDLAFKDIKLKQSVVLVEGQMDVLMMHQAGYTNTVATSGTAFTDEHIRLLKRFTNNFVLALDNDKAGFMASMRACELLLKNDSFIEVIDFDGKDPAEIIKNNPNDFARYYKAKKYFFDFIIDYYLSKIDIKDHIMKEKTVKKLLEITSNASGEVTKEELVRIISVRLNLSEEGLIKDLKNVKAKNYEKDNKNSSMVIPHKIDENDYLFVFNKLYPDIFKEYKSELENIGLDSRFFQEKVYNLSQNNYNVSLEDNNQSNSNKNKSNQDLNRGLIGLEMLLGEYYADYTKEELINELQRIILRYKKKYKSNKLSGLTLEIRIAEENNDSSKIEELQSELIKILKL